MCASVIINLCQYRVPPPYYFCSAVRVIKATGAHRCSSGSTDPEPSVRWLTPDALPRAQLFLLCHSERAFSAVRKRGRAITPVGGLFGVCAALKTSEENSEQPRRPLNTDKRAATISQHPLPPSPPPPLPLPRLHARRRRADTHRQTDRHTEDCCRYSARTLTTKR